MPKSMTATSSTPPTVYFSNADGAYGANVNFLIGASAWTDDQDDGRHLHKPQGLRDRPQGQVLGAGRTAQRCLRQGRHGLPEPRLGRTRRDHDRPLLRHAGRHLQGRQSLAQDGKQLPVFISDQTQGDGKVRTLGEQVALETRTRSLNPKWFEGMLAHGYEGVRQIEAQISNTVGWSATTGDVEPWVYQKLSETFILDEAPCAGGFRRLNPASSLRMVNRLIEAKDRNLLDSRTTRPGPRSALRARKWKTACRGHVRRRLAA
jgi:magnesium chelatase subunit H